jgi:hypothetical protein
VVESFHFDVSHQGRIDSGGRIPNHWRPKVYFIERFKGIMFLTLKNADRTIIPVPPWALERMKIAFNAQDAQEVPGGGAALGLITPKA